MYSASLSNIWGSLHGKVQQHWGLVEKTVAYKKKWLTWDQKSFIALIDPNQERNDILVNEKTAV